MIFGYMSPARLFISIIITLGALWVIANSVIRLKNPKYEDDELYTLSALLMIAIAISWIH